VAGDVFLGYSARWLPYLRYKIAFRRRFFSHFQCMSDGNITHRKNSRICPSKAFTEEAGSCYRGVSEIGAPDHQPHCHQLYSRAWARLRGIPFPAKAETASPIGRQLSRIQFHVTRHSHVAHLPSLGQCPIRCRSRICLHLATSKGGNCVADPCHQTGNQAESLRFFPDHSFKCRLL
jgi:hypothetical protein